MHFLVAAVNGNTCRPVHAIGATTPAPLGSAFKLYVLDALARAVAAGKVSWDQPLTVTSQVKSLPSGDTAERPRRHQVSVRQVAAGMISISDNTAANMLIALLGRSRGRGGDPGTGMADPALDVPFLTTRELFVLKLDRLAEAGQALPGPRRRRAAGAVVGHRRPGPAEHAAARPPGPAPRHRLARVVRLADRHLPRVRLARHAGPAARSWPRWRRILERNAGGMSLDPSQWRPVWFKGGSEPGVLTLNYLATTRSGQAYVVSVLAENPAPLAQTPAIPTLITAVKGALQLAAGRGRATGRRPGG